MAETRHYVELTQDGTVASDQIATQDPELWKLFDAERAANPKARIVLVALSAQVPKDLTGYRYDANTKTFAAPAPEVPKAPVETPLVASLLDVLIAATGADDAMTRAEFEARYLFHLSGGKG